MKRKIAKRHSTMIGAAKKLVRALEMRPEVTNISLGIITKARPLQSFAVRVKCIEVSGGLRASVRGNSSVQQIFIYTNDRPKTMQCIVDFSSSL
jgi:hypothetical protein